VPSERQGDRCICYPIDTFVHLSLRRNGRRRGERYDRGDVAHRPTVRAANGVVASGHHLATAAAIASLREGGSAVDAAITAAAVCAVVLPKATSIGGDVFALVYAAGTGDVLAYNGSGAGG